MDRLRREPAHAGDLTAQALERLPQPRTHRLVEGEGNEGANLTVFRSRGMNPRSLIERGGPSGPPRTPRHAAGRPSSARRSISRDAWEA